MKLTHKEKYINEFIDEYHGGDWTCKEELIEVAKNTRGYHGAVLRDSWDDLVLAIAIGLKVDKLVDWLGSKAS